MCFIQFIIFSGDWCENIKQESDEKSFNLQFSQCQMKDFNINLFIVHVRFQREKKSVDKEKQGYLHSPRFGQTHYASANEGPKRCNRNPSVPINQTGFRMFRVNSKVWRLPSNLAPIAIANSHRTLPNSHWKAADEDRGWRCSGRGGTNEMVWGSCESNGSSW